MRKMRFIAAAALLLSACDFNVVNPGPIADTALDDPGAWPGIVTGIQYNTARAIGIDAFYSAVAAKEYRESGRVNATKLPAVQGQLSVDDVSANTWYWSQGARWQAEDGARRVQRVLGAAGAAANKPAGQMLMYGAIANRILGENMCEAVIDGGAKQTINAAHGVTDAHFIRADSEATEAIAVLTAAGDAADAAIARATRAQIRMYLQNFAGAAADAIAVANTVKFVAPFDATTHNIIVDTNDAAIGGSFKAHTVLSTYFEKYYLATGDPRVQWDSSLTVRNGEITGVAWDRQEKYSAATGGYNSPITLVNGREMRLIEAEVKLRASDIPGAMGLINGIRQTVVSKGGTAVAAGAFLPAYPDPTLGGGLAEAWMDLFHEKRIELWLEGRSMGDLRRWIADGTYGTFIVPGTYSQAFATTNVATAKADSSENIANRVRLCLPIARLERQTNSTFPDLTINDPASPIFDNTIAPW